MSNKRRLHYFNGQLLDQSDFRDEQEYHLAMRRLHNRAFHSWGVVEGLEVNKSANREITIMPGFALDPDGREIIVPKLILHDTRRSERHSQLHVVLTYKEELERQEHQSDGMDRPLGANQGSNRVGEFAELHLVPDFDKIIAGVPLGTVHLDAVGDITHISHQIRQIAALILPHGSVHTKHLADGCVTAPKLSPELLESFNQMDFTVPDESITFEKLSHEVRSRIGARGWVRLPFRPERMRPKTARWPAGDGEFSLDLEFAHCDHRGARGSMAIPIPAGASYIREFRIAGITQKQVNVHLLRTGWNSRDRKGETLTIFKEELRNAVFDHKFTTERELDEFHAITVSVHATGESEIWLVAAKFE